MRLGGPGFGCPELGSFSLAEIASVRLPFGLGIERDILFEGQFPLSFYAEAARLAGRIVLAELRLTAGRRTAGGPVMRFREWPRPTAY